MIKFPLLFTILVNVWPFLPKMTFLVLKITTISTQKRRKPLKFCVLVLRQAPLETIMRVTTLAHSAKKFRLNRYLT